MKSFGPPRDHIAGRDYSTAIRGRLLDDATIDNYIRCGHYGPERQSELLAAERDAKPKKRVRKFNPMAEAMKLLGL